MSTRGKFRVGDCVETAKGEKCIIRFMGKVEGFSTNTVYGIEYIDGTIGEHNGKFKGKKYFIGLPKRCAFIRYSTIRRKAKYYDVRKGEKVRFNSVQSRIAKFEKPKQAKHRKKESSKCVRSEKLRPSKKRRSLPTKIKEFTETKHRKKTRIRSKKRKSLPTKLNKEGAPNINAKLDDLDDLTKSKKKNFKNNRSRKSNEFGKAQTPKNECSMYKHERIHFSQMDALDFSALDLQEMERESECDEVSVDTPPLRKNASIKIRLSEDSLNEYHLKRNLVIGDIYTAHRYQLKDGRHGICMYVGPLHWINNGVMDTENEFIGIALEKGEGMICDFG